MHPCLDSHELSRSIRIVFIPVLTVLLSGWTTCTALLGFNSCVGAVPPPQISTLSPNTISMDATSVLLTVNGSGFGPQSQILWNRNPLPTMFVDSRELQTTITQQTLDSFGGSAGASVQISVLSPVSNPVVVGCPNGGASAALVLFIN
jgi:hypothetical protein